MPSSDHKNQVTGDPVAATTSVRTAERMPLSFDVALDLALYGVLLVGLNLTARHLLPAFPLLTLFTGLVGGGLCILWAVLGRRGTRCRGSAMVTLAVVACVFVPQAVQSWAVSTESRWNDRKVALLMTLLVFFCAAMLAKLVREGKAPPP
jgi:hypothetical protein